MAKFIGSTNLTYLWDKIKSIFATKTELEAKPTGRIYYGTCSSTGSATTKVATVETFPLDSNNKPLVGTCVCIYFTVSNTYKTAGTTMKLNVNSTGDFPFYYNNAEVVSTTSANTLVCGYKNRNCLYMFNGTQWVFLSASYDANSTYSGMTQAEITTGTSTTARLLTPKMLRDNFYTEAEVDGLLDDKQDTIDDLTDIRSGAALGATALQSFTETDPVFSSSAAHGISSSDITSWNGKVGSTDVTTIVKMTQSAYDALASVDSNTLYLIVES